MTTKRSSPDTEAPDATSTESEASDCPPKRRKVASFESGATQTNVRVVARLRPLSSKEKAEHSKSVLQAVIGSNTIVDKSSSSQKSYQYDAVLTPEVSQSEVYRQTAGNMIESSIFQGFNVTVLAYGQTGAGKTYTMGTATAASITTDELSAPDEADGIIPRAVYDLFRTRQQMVNGEERVKVQMSYLEIYNEEARDLLAVDGNGSNLCIRDSKTEGIIVQGLTWTSVESPREVHNCIESAAQRRVTASTHMNAVSSRSHAICTLRVTIAAPPGDCEESQEVRARLTLVDLAGSERMKRTGAEGDRMKEGININKGLFVLGQVVACLSDKGGSNGPNNSMHVPYRDSKLTRLLQDSLGGNSRTIMIACVSPAESNTEESLNTLRYAQRARNIRNEATKNVLATAGLSPEQAAELRRENQLLKLKVSNLKSKLTNLSTAEQNNTSTSTAILCGSESSNSISQIGLATERFNMENLELVSKLRATLAAQEAKIDQLEDIARSSSEDSLEASLKADRAQLKLEELKALAKSQGVELQCMGSNQEDLMQSQRKEIQDLKQQLQDERMDCEIARATAASIITCSGDMLKAEEVALAGGTFEECKGNNRDDQLSAELVAVSGDIEIKEDLVRKAMKERECMEAMRSHFETVLTSLQNEVTVLSAEREQLLSNIGTKSQPGVTKMMQKRIKELEERIQNLRSKADEQKRTLRLRDIAEKKCAKLTAEIQADKKRRAMLQKKLKAESEDRRNERKAAKTQAAKLVRDGQKLKLELQKVRSAAERQAAVLRRKAAEAVSKQKRLAEQQKKRNKAANSRNRNARTKTELTDMREQELFGWLNSEFEAAATITNVDEQIEQQELIVDEVFHKLKEIGDSDPANKKALEEEIEHRQSILTQLQKNSDDFKKSLGLSKHCNFQDSAMWNQLNGTELKILFMKVFDEVSTLRRDSEKVKERCKKDISQAVSVAISKEKAKADEAIMVARLEQSEEFALLLDSTRSAIENCASKSSSVLVNKDEAESVLGEYMNRCSSIGGRLTGQLTELKNQRDAMKTMMDEVASEIVSKTEAKRKKGKKKTVQKRSSVGRASEIFTFEEDEIDVVEEDGNDSDWSPDQSPAKKKAKALNVQDEQEESAEKELTMRKESISSCYASKKVSELRVLLRERGLKVSGKKQELIARLVTSEKSLSEEEGTKEERKARTIEGSEDDKENRGVHVSDTGSKVGRERKALVVINTKDSQEKKESFNSEEDKEGKLPMLLSRSAKKRKRRSMVDAVNTAMQALSNLENTI